MSEILVSQLAYAELLTPKPQETVDWLVNVLGLEETTRRDQTVYLRGWGEWLHSSLLVTEAPQSGIGATGWRAYGPGDPEKVEKIVREAGVAVGWAPERPGRGTAFQFRSPFGQHLHEVFWEAERYQAPPAKAEPELRFRPQRFPGRGANARYIDHVTLASPNLQGDIDFFAQLGFRQTAAIAPEPGFRVFSTTTSNAVRCTHDMAFVPDFSGATGRLNHIAYRVDQRHDVEIAAEACMANGTRLEFGPGIHGIDEITFLYMREPGGNVRFEINSGGWQNYMPDWECAEWLPHQGPNVIWRNQPFVDSMTESFPPVTEELARKDHEAFVGTGVADQAVGLNPDRTGSEPR
jgi:catechol 2,3-dioxygenase